MKDKCPKCGSNNTTIEYEDGYSWNETCLDHIIRNNKIKGKK